MPYLVCKRNKETGFDEYLLGDNESTQAWVSLGERHKAKRFATRREAEDRVPHLHHNEGEEIVVVEKTDYHRRPTWS